MSSIIQPGEVVHDDPIAKIQDGSLPVTESTPVTGKPQPHKSGVAEELGEEVGEDGESDGYTNFSMYEEILGLDLKEFPNGKGKLINLNNGLVLSL